MENPVLVACPSWRATNCDGALFLEELDGTDGGAPGDLGLMADPVVAELGPRIIAVGVVCNCDQYEPFMTRR